VRKNQNYIEHLPDATTVLTLEYKGRWLPCYIDTANYAKIKDYQWRILKNRRTFYARTDGRDESGRLKILYMHVLLFPNPEVLVNGVTVDHRDRNGLNNRTANLRNATKREQAQNRNPRPGGFQIYIRTTGTPYRPVLCPEGNPEIPREYKGKFYLRVSENGKRTWLPFATIGEAMIGHSGFIDNATNPSKCYQLYSFGCPTVS